MMAWTAFLRALVSYSFRCFSGHRHFPTTKCALKLPMVCSHTGKVLLFNIISMIACYLPVFPGQQLSKLTTAWWTTGTNIMRNKAVAQISIWGNVWWMSTPCHSQYKSCCACRSGQSSRRQKTLIQLLLEQLEICEIRGFSRCWIPIPINWLSMLKWLVS